jgi:SAM-dependent methyltransferase
MLLTRELLRFFRRGTLIEFSKDVWPIYHALPPAVQTRLKLLVIDFMEHDVTADYDCVIACEVMEHVQDDVTFLKKLFAALKNRGQLILSVPARMRFWSQHDEIAGHLRRYEWDDLVTLLVGVGFQDVQIRAYGFPFVNLLDIPRIWYANRQMVNTMHITAEEQTKVSGIAQTAGMPSWLGWFLNPLTIYPLNLLSDLFNKLDLSGAYIVTATK